MSNACADGESSVEKLPTNSSPSGVRCDSADPAQLRLSDELTMRLRLLAQQRGVPFIATVLSGWVVLVGRCSGQEEAAISTRVARNRRLESEPLIGVEDALFLRVRLQQDATMGQILKEIGTAVVDACAQGRVPFAQFMEALKPGVDHDLVFRVLSLNAPAAAIVGTMERQGHRVTLGEVSIVISNTKPEPTLWLGDEEAGFASVLRERETTERIAACFQVLLEGMLTDIEQPVSRLPLLTADEREQVLYAFNDTATAYPHDGLIHQLFEQQVQRTPHAVALVHEQQSMTYAELNVRANQLARFLRDLGVSPDDLVVLCVERSLEMVVGMLAILKSGGAYVPLDPAYPYERLAYMLRDAAPRVLLTQERVRHTLPPTTAQVISLDGTLSAGCEEANLDPCLLRLTSRHLAYVIYTSGSTGAPKGVAAEHRGMVNRIVAQAAIGAYSGDDICCQKTSVGFVDGIFETLGPLSYGRPLVLASEAAAKDVRQLAALIERERITRLVTVPTLADSLLASVGSTQSLRRLRGWTLSGEELKGEVLRRLQGRLPNCIFTNLYGSSEVAADVTCYVSTESEHGRVPIGRPIANTQIYILDRHLQPVPIGVDGEIYIGGVGVARGYLNRPELTAERFIPDPFGHDPQARIYQSGDLGRWREDGTIDYRGRADSQVKIRGFRIELGEIEARLARHAQVKEAVVIAREDDQQAKRLIAYITRRDQFGPKTEDLRDYLNAALPKYMVPSAFVILDSFPLTPSGKLDRRALPAPDLEAYASPQYEAPRGEVEEILAAIWQELLGVERVGRQDNFFGCGGHSLLIVQMVERLRRAGLSAEVHRVFESPTLADLASALTSEALGQLEVPPNLIPLECEVITPQMLPLVQLDAEQIERIVQSVPGGAANIQDIYPLAPLQEGILFHHLLDEQRGDTYVLPTVLSVSSRARVEELIAALQGVIDRHDVLRTAVLWEQLPQPVQVVYRKATLRVDEIVLDRDCDPKEQVREWMKPERLRMDLRQAPLIRLQLAAEAHGGQRYALLQTHHMIDDDISLKIVVSEVVAHLGGLAEKLPEPVPYRNHVAQVLAHARKRDSAAFFRGKFGDISEPTAPFGLLDVHGDGSRIKEACQELGPALAQRVRIQARRLSVSVASLLHACWGLVVARASGRDDVVFGSVLLGRLQGRAGAERVVGMFVNTLPLCLRLRDVTARELVEQTQRELTELLDHEQASLAIAQRCSGIAGSAPLFSAVLNYRHSAPNPEAEWASTLGIRVVSHQSRTNYPFAFSVDDRGDGFALTAQTDQRIDPDRVLGYMETAMESLVEALEQSSLTPALALPILPMSERHQVIESFNATQAGYPHELIHVLFEEQVERTPDAIAVAHEGRSLSYAGLNRRANQLARHLRDRGVGPDRLVAICIERSVEMLVGLLGVLKAGGAYVPLDPTNPPERLEHVLADAEPEVVLTQEGLKGTLPWTTAEVIVLDRDWGEFANRSDENLDPHLMQLTTHNLAYVIYTSGSTGQPKGVMVEHRNIVNYAVHALRQFDVEAGNGSLICTSISFDLMLTGLYPVLLCGRTVRLCSEERGLPALTDEILHCNNLAPLKLTPSHMALLEHALRSGQLAGRVRVLVLGGEPLQAGAVQLWKSYSPDTRIFNHYGPTEATVGCVVNEVGDPVSGAVPIGRPISNTQIYILNRLLKAIPIGVAGEIYIGGAGVARGYLNQPELTAELFVADPFSADPQARIYKTGDVGRWRPDGTIEYLGRNDHQVKIRGYRIELGEIEAQLARHKQVKEAVVLVYESIPGEKRLVAYTTSRDRCHPSVEELRAHLQVVLPQYMIPSAFVILPTFPLTPNGKLDRGALPAPEFKTYASRECEAPLGEIEEALARIWQKLLQVERVGRDDNFFDLGGHSLLAIQVIVRVQSLFSIKMSMRSLFDNPTLKQLSMQVGDLRQVHLVQSISAGGDEIDQLLDRVASLPESKILELVRGLRREGKP